MTVANKKQERVTIKLENYESIFSDFDPRPYSARSLSDDFLIALRHATQVVHGAFSLVMLVPEGQRKKESEAVILKRVQSHVQRHKMMLEKTRKKEVRSGLLIAATGMILIVLATLLDSYSNLSVLAHGFRILFEPAGWFISWFGLDRVFYDSKEEREALRFYRTIEKAEFGFGSF